MAGFFDRFRNPEKLRRLEEERVAKEALDEVARQESAKQRRKQEAADRLASKALNNEKRKQAKIDTLRNEDRLARSQWTYQDIGDEMRGTTMSMAQLISTNSVEFPFPYNGGCQGLLALRSTGKAIEAIFTVTNGQLDGFDSYQINTKVDDGPILNWSGNGPDQINHTLMFVSNPALFIQHFQNGDRLIFETFFYQHGRAQFTFNVAGLDTRFQVS